MTLDNNTAATLLSQLGNMTRLKIVRLLVRAGEKGLSVGDIQRYLEIPGSTLSHHLTYLRNAGLIRQEREGTVLRCFAEYGTLGALIAFLMNDCCAGVDICKNR
ncbi:MAG: helix-turn-helix transcriptional regulator [Deltaproteobacteria bacterium]|nr:helix-turn-helix transcriptional regulator [Deltaproteobacteria bacterium]